MSVLRVEVRVIIILNFNSIFVGGVREWIIIGFECFGLKWVFNVGF